MARKVNLELRQSILDAGEKCFTQRGYNGVSVREIAREADTSVSNIYAHFDNKENLFRTILDDYEEEYFNQSQITSAFIKNFTLPDSLEDMGRASEAMVEKFTNYLKLIYVDVVEFQGVNITRVFSHMRKRYEKSFGPALAELQEKGVLNPHIDPVAALMVISMSYFNYFTVERVFGAENHFGMDDKEVISQIAHLFSYGLISRKEGTKVEKKNKKKKTTAGK